MAEKKPAVKPDLVALTKVEDALRDAAFAKFKDNGDIELTEDAQVQLAEEDSEPGAWVHARVWVGVREGHLKPDVEALAHKIHDEDWPWGFRG